MAGRLRAWVHAGGGGASVLLRVSVNVFVCLCDKVTKECEATSVPCDQAQVAISGAQLLLVRSVSGCCRCRWPAAIPGSGGLLVSLAFVC